MDRLSILDCKSFFKYFLQGILSEGIISPLQTFSTKNSSLKSATCSWKKSVLDGLAFRESLEAMSPRFPACVEELLAVSAEKSVLDKAVTELIALYSESNSELTLLESVTRLINNYEVYNTGGIICEGCLERDLIKILGRALLEQAYEVILEQDGESYFHQKYLGTKLIHVVESSHSMVLRSIQKKLNYAVSNGILYFAEADKSYSIVRLGDNRYKLQGYNQALIISC